MSEERQLVVETVHDAEQHGGGEWLPENLAAAIAWLQAKLDAVPEASRSSARVDIGTESDYAATHATLKISYERRETDAEFAARRAAEIERAEREVSHAREVLGHAEGKLRLAKGETGDGGSGT